MRRGGIWNLEFEFWVAHRQILLPLVGAIENLWDILNNWSISVFTDKHLKLNHSRLLSFYYYH
jgi:hypothetical protein